MNKLLVKGLLFSFFLNSLASCATKEIKKHPARYDYGNIIDIAYTPNANNRCTGWFTDQGSWMGFTPAQPNDWVNGFCGPFGLDNRQWLCRSAVEVTFKPGETFRPDSVSYFPGELFLSASSKNGQITQRLIFIDKSSALLQCSSNKKEYLRMSSNGINKDVKLTIDQNICLFNLADRKIMTLTFAPNTKVVATADGYEAISNSKGQLEVVISYYQNEKELTAGQQKADLVLTNPHKFILDNNERWDSYLTKTLRSDLPNEYNRIAVKSIVTLISNWRSKQGGLLHDGIVPSHAVGYFVGFWAWDSWKHAVGIASFAPELAKEQIRAMFDYQLPDGMIIDCIYSDISENNARDSKPPLAAWAVSEVFKATRDTAFVQEMYPQLLRYYHWWYANRDHNGNGICEFGSTDGTTEAAAWESGMDNAIRFDSTKMVKNNEAAWSFDQESVDLNAYLALEYRLLGELAPIAGTSFEEPDRTANVANYFFNADRGYFFDRRLKDGSFVLEEGSEGYIPLWTGIATKEQADKALKLFTDTARFATFIPCPTVAANNPKFLPKGYWRGPIWLDQTYFGISGLRKYGYKELADNYTRQVFDRLQGLKTDGAIHENYGTHTGKMLKAPHFSWSSAHLLMLYKELGK